MTSFRSIAVALSLIVHGSLGYAMWPSRNEIPASALDAGADNDTFTVEQGIGIDSIVKMGDDRETIHTTEVQPVEAQKPPAEEIKPVEELRDTITSTSVAAIEDNVVKTEDPPPVAEAKQPEPISAIEQPQQVATAKDESSGRQQTGGDASAMTAYYGKLSKLIEGSKLKPKKRAAGKVQILMTIDSEGRLLSRTVKTSSGNAMLDDTALEIVDRIAPKMPGVMPKGLVSQQLSIPLPFNFEIR